MNYSYYVVLLFVFYIMSCSTETNDLNHKDDDPIITYEIKENTKDYFDWERFADVQKIIPLETSDRSLIGYFYKGVIIKNRIIIGDTRFHNAYIFNEDGKFINKLGKKGKGPKEYIEMRDLCVQDTLIYTLDYQKVHSYNINNGAYVSTFNFERGKGFNPSNLLIFDTDNYYLWNSNPDVWDPTDGKFYRLIHYVKNQPEKKYFRYRYFTNDDNRFYPRNDESFYIKPIDGEYIIYLVNNKGVAPAFKLEFENKSLTKEKAHNLRNSEERNAYFKSDYYKSIFNVFEIDNFIYFACIGPNAKKYEGIINKNTGNCKFGLYNFTTSPDIFYSDGKYLYGYIEPHRILEKGLDYTNDNSLIYKLKEIAPNVKIEDNFFIVKLSMKNKFDEK